MSQREEQSFEKDLEELESVVERLERGSLPLDESLAAFERGMKLADRAERRLAAAEERVEILVRGPGGEDEAVAFAEAHPDVDLSPSGE